MLDQDIERHMSHVYSERGSISPGIFVSSLLEPGRLLANHFHRHLNDVYRLEQDGIPVHWYISKTPRSLLEQNRQRLLGLLAANNNEEIAKIVLERVEEIGLYDIEELPEQLLNPEIVSSYTMGTPLPLREEIDPEAFKRLLDMTVSPKN